MTRRFQSYAARIKHITFTATPRVPNRGLTHFPNLRTVILQGEGCLIQPRCLESPLLEQMEIDLSSMRDKPSVRMRGHILAETLAEVPPLLRGLKHLRVRGFMSSALDYTIPSFRSLDSLTLVTGKSLSAETLAALGLFPHLRDLCVHASHIDSDDFARAISTHTSQPFGNLQNLRIRASRSLLCTFVDVLPRHTLRSLYIETEEPAQGPTAWKTILALIALKAADTLIEFTLDQILDPQELETQLSSVGFDTRFALDTLQPLSELRALRRLTIDAMLLPDFTDRDIDEMASWWPNLEHLDIGALPDSEDRTSDWSPKLTVLALQYLAKRCPSLQTLTMPLDFSAQAFPVSDAGKASDKPKVVKQRNLRRLLVGPPPSDDRIAALVKRVAAIFPCVEEIECASAGRTLSIEVRTVDERPAGEVECCAGTPDGFANGQ